MSWWSFLSGMLIGGAAAVLLPRYYRWTHAGDGEEGATFEEVFRPPGDRL